MISLVSKDIFTKKHYGRGFWRLNFFKTLSYSSMAKHPLALGLDLFYKRHVKPRHFVTI
jgi:hypothetical protein